jgi:hypothetical protein
LLEAGGQNKLGAPAFTAQGQALNLNLDGNRGRSDPGGGGGIPGVTQDRDASNHGDQKTGGDQEFPEDWWRRFHGVRSSFSG